MQRLEEEKLITDLTNTSGRLAKEKLIEQAILTNEAILEFIGEALNPYITYGITSKNVKFEVSDETNYNIDEWYDDVNTTLKNLRTRDVTGNAAIQEIELVLSQYPKSYGETFLKILNKDLRAGCGLDTFNRVLKRLGHDLIPTYECMLASPDGNIKYPVLAQPKLDGVRCQVFVTKSGIKYFSRNGKEYLNFSEFDDKFKSVIPGNVLDGEMMGTSFDALMKDVHKKKKTKNGDLVYHIFDIIPLSDFKKQICIIKQSDRSENLLHLEDTLDSNKVRIVKGKICNNEKELNEYYAECVAEGYEGIIAKNPNGFYEYKRSKNWIKMKPMDNVDLKIIDVHEGEGKYKGSMGFVRVNFKGKHVSVGSGFTDDLRKQIWKDKYGYEGRTIEVKYQEVTKDGSLRFPTFVQFRPDKD